MDGSGRALERNVPKGPIGLWAIEMREWISVRLTWHHGVIANPCQSATIKLAHRRHAPR